MIDIILHIGRHKSGTSSLQRALSENRILLKSNGYYYPTVYRKKWAHHQLVQAINEEDNPKHQKAFIDGLSREYINIISSEAFQNIPPKIVREFFDEKIFRVKVVCYLRDQVDYLKSSYLQEIKATTTTITPKEYINSSKLDYFEFAKEWSRYFDISFDIYDKSYLINGSMVDEFFIKHLSISSPPEAEYRENSSLTRKMFAYKYRYNQQKEQLHLQSLAAFYFALSRLSAIDDSGAYQFDLQTIQSIKAQYQKSNEMLFEYFLDGKRFQDRTYCNTKPYIISDSEYNQITNEIKKLMQEFVPYHKK